jgi:CMP-N,N'-diacetyllegionaminic acid synthase
MKILAIIPARSGSKGVPGKNTKLLGGKPLLAYTIEKALASRYITELMLTTDSEEIAKVGKVCGIAVPFLRPAHLATDTASSIEVVQHVLDYYETQGKVFDVICLLQPTSPFRPDGMIDQAIETFMAKQTDALVSVLPVPHEYNPHWVFESQENGILHIATGERTIIKRRQDLPPAFFRDGAIYITKTQAIREGSFLGNSLSFIESNPDFYVNIDTMEDWTRAEEKMVVLRDRV